MYDYSFEVNIGSKKISCRAFTLEQYLNLINAKLNKTIEPTIKQLINDCTNAMGLNKQESELLIIHLWAHSLGEVNKETTWKCACGHETPTHINLLHSQIDEPDTLEYTIRDIKLALRYPDIFDDSNVGQMIAKCITGIYANGEHINIDDLTDKEIDDLYSIISEDDIIALKEMLLKPSVYLAVPIKCGHCGASHVQVIKGLREFFEII